MPANHKCIYIVCAVYVYRTCFSAGGCSGSHARARGNCQVFHAKREHKVTKKQGPTGCITLQSSELDYCQQEKSAIFFTNTNDIAANVIFTVDHKLRTFEKYRGMLMPVSVTLHYELTDIHMLCVYTIPQLPILHLSNNPCVP